MVTFKGFEHNGKEKEQKYLRHIGMEAKVQGTSLAAVITVPVQRRG